MRRGERRLPNSQTALGKEAAREAKWSRGENRLPNSQVTLETEAAWKAGLSRRAGRLPNIQVALGTKTAWKAGLPRRASGLPNSQAVLGKATPPGETDFLEEKAGCRTARRPKERRYPGKPNRLEGKTSCR